MGKNIAGNKSVQAGLEAKAEAGFWILELVMVLKLEAGSWKVNVES